MARRICEFTDLATYRSHIFDQKSITDLINDQYKMHQRPVKWWTDQEHEGNKGQKNNMSRAHSVTSEMAVILEGSLGLHNREIHNLLFLQQMFQL